MRELVNIILKSGEIKIIVVRKSRAKLTDERNKFKTKFNKIFLKLTVNFELDNGFLVFAICQFSKLLKSQWFLIQYLLHFKASLILSHF